MLAVPVPFLLAIAIVLLLAAPWARARGPGDRPFAGLLLLAALQSALVGLRWTLDLPALRLLLPVTAAMLPPLA